MIKILHIVHALTRGGGLSNFIMNYYRVIDRTKIQFDFIFFKESENDFKDEITALGGRYFKFTEPSISFTYIKERKKFFIEHNGEYTAIHCHVLFAAAIYANTAKKYGVKNIIAHSHSVSYGNGLVRKLRNRYLVGKAKRLATHYMACSEDAALFMFSKGACESGKVIIISNAIDCNKYIFDKNVRRDIRIKLEIEDSFIIGHVGGFTEQKNHDFLIDVFVEICRLRPNSILLLAGGDGIASGSTKSAIIEKVERLGIKDRVKFLGICRDVNQLMAAMDVFVFPSIFEGFGLVLVEAQTAGLPSFTSNNVPITVKCTELVAYLPLIMGAEEWAKIIVNYDFNKQSRIMDVNIFDQYNIEKQNRILENIYIGMD